MTNEAAKYGGQKKEIPTETATPRQCWPSGADPTSMQGGDVRISQAAIQHFSKAYLDPPKLSKPSSLARGAVAIDRLPFK